MSEREIGVRRSVTADAAEAWELVTTRPELWLGPGSSVSFDDGSSYEVPPRNGAPGASGEVSDVRPGVRLRMTWQPDGWAAPATLQLSLLESRPGRTALDARLGRLPDGEAREAARARWREALERLAASAADGDPGRR